MIRLNYTLEIITPCFCGGAEPEQQAEIRPASIRGQLRWWFRVLGGFKSLAPMPVREQEAMIFGSTACDEGNAGKWSIRVRTSQLTTSRKDSEGLGHRPFSDPAFLTFPLQSRTNLDGHRGVVDGGTFELVSIWRGRTGLASDLVSLISVFANLGALGFRSRRAMGALADAQGKLPTLEVSLTRFANPDSIVLRSLPANSSKNAISVLGGWLKGCRAHGLTVQIPQKMKSPFFQYAKNDHDVGYQMPETANSPAFRPAIGLPIIQRTKRGTNNWEFGQGSANHPKGRFASPVILRPHRDSNGNWLALVIFVDAKKWPDDPSTGQPKPVFLNGSSRAVSRDLYEAMKNDPNLETYPL